MNSWTAASSLIFHSIYLDDIIQYIGECVQLAQEMIETTLLAGKYVYLSDLQVCNGRVPVVPRSLPPEVTIISTPLLAQEWQSQLELRPNKEFCQYLLDGFK